MRGAHISVVILVLTLTLSGCGLHSSFVEKMDLRATELLAKENPAEVVILPVLDATGNPQVQMLLPNLQRALYLEIKSKCYTPLSQDYVAGILQEKSAGPAPSVASLLGRFKEDAILIVKVTAWSERRLQVDRKLRATLDLHLVSARSKAELWGGSIITQVSVGGHGMVGPHEIPGLLREGVKLLAKRALAELPLRKLLLKG